MCPVVLGESTTYIVRWTFRLQGCLKEDTVNPTVARRLLAAGLVKEGEKKNMLFVASLILPPDFPLHPGNSL